MRLRTRLVIPVFFAALAAAIGCGSEKVADGPPDRSPTPTATPTAGRHHPVGFADAAQHGPYAKFLSEDCKSCHGANLDGVGAAAGTPAQGCDTCHTAGWRQNCTFCHGGQDNQSGAPARDITELIGTVTANPIFKNHTAHVTAGADHVAFDCNQCHAQKPTDIMTPGHWIVGDSTPGFAEVDFSNGLNAGGTFGVSGQGQCNNSYCHGTARAATPNNGTVTQGTAMTCHSCHGNNDGSNTTSTMSHEHGHHLGNDIGAKCVDCHSKVVDATNAIIDVTLHVNKVKDTSFGATNIAYANGRCTGSCHGKNHQNLNWPK